MTAPYERATGAESGPGGTTAPGPVPLSGPTAPPAHTGPRAVPLPAELADAARALFGDRLDLAEAYADLLATDGVVRGLIGPREAPRIWERHLLNCAAVAELIPTGASVVDVGSGAGLPGLVLAVARPDLAVTLVEPLARRTAFLSEAVAALGLEDTVTVLRARAEDAIPDAGRDALPSPADIVTARAVAPLDRLAGWCLPLAAIGGRVLALKGASAADEVVQHRDVIDRFGGGTPVVRCCGVELIEPPTTVVEIVRERDVVPARAGSSRKAARSGRRSKSEGRPGRGRSRRD
ncbi:16S rRNA m(7)G-527 methyltransferase [Micromonospora pattaloongensis]|uniref:Ribosomal RNA small subunit methyltransferase G n=1 Tax=Micromonospora pattaloongensis TaxID=405436 RepID=A0A1H3HVL8_9ACTN|nr:16S rRNA (guanine(527)-N(7))-methyltransferase RsmG [Micromonospora pattaloongensis]SDY19536.1 16S rRNA m(7)G-527 methyltransferase [Micromonospora pattaloongensis]